MSKRTGYLVIAILAIVMTRLIPHPPNFAPILSIAIFGGAMFRSKWLAVVLPFGAMILSDIILESLQMAGLRQFGGFHPTVWAVYLSFGIAILFGMMMSNNTRPLNIIGTSILSSIGFFILTNFAVYLAYPGLTLLGSYVAALPFFINTLAGALFFSAVLFGIHALVSKRYPVLA